MTNRQDTRTDSTTTDRDTETGAGAPPQSPAMTLDEATDAYAYSHASLLLWKLRQPAGE